MADRDPDYVDNEDDEADDEEVGGTEARGAKKCERRKRLCERVEANRSSVEWQCVTIVNEDDDVNPVVQCKFCPWKSGAGATSIRQHILHSGQAAKCKGSSEEYIQSYEVKAAREGAATAA